MLKEFSWENLRIFKIADFSVRSYACERMFLLYDLEQVACSELLYGFRGSLNFCWTVSKCDVVKCKVGENDK